MNYQPTALSSELNTESEKQLLLKAYKLMCTAIALTELYEANSSKTAKYVHATSRGHEAIQLAVGLQLKAQDYLSAYYRDDSLLLGIGITPFELMLQLRAKKDDPFSGGRTYYCHPSLKREGFPKIPHQSSATGMQAIPATGLAMGIQYLEDQKLAAKTDQKPIVLCSLGDASVTEGEVSEAFQMAVLHQYPILYLVQDNGWDISASADEIRAMDASEYALGFKGLEVRSIDGTDFINSYRSINEVISLIRTERRPFLVHAKVPLLNHHTSGVRKEWYRHDLETEMKRDPYPKFRAELIHIGFSEDALEELMKTAQKEVAAEFEKVEKSADPSPEDLYTHVFAPTTVTEEKGERSPASRKEETLMVDCGLFAIKEIMKKHPESLFYGQDVGRRLGGVFREAATLAQTFGDSRVFNTPIQEAYIIGSTVGMSATGCKPIVEIQFGDYIWPGLNQLFTEVSRSCYLSNGKWPVSTLIRVPVGAYGSGGPYHSSSIESVLSNIRGIKVAYPSNGADLKGLLKAAYYDPNPVVMLEHKGLYWSKVKGTETAKSIEPSEDYIIPLGKARLDTAADPDKIKAGESMCVISCGMGVHWAKNAAKFFDGRVEVLDLRCIVPLDEDAVFDSVQKHGRCLVLTEEPHGNSFAQALAGNIQEQCFKYLDAPVMVLGAEDVPAVPLNSVLEKTMMPSVEKVRQKIEILLAY